ncbi:MAG: matrixin family metalloprotease [Candidatus Methanomethylicia archaeon]
MKYMNKKITVLSIFIIIFLTATTANTWTKPSEQLLVIEWSLEKTGQTTGNSIPPEDNSMTNPNYKLLNFYWHTTPIKYYVNPSNKYGFTANQIVNIIITAANTWDNQTSTTLFQYMGTTTKTAGRRDGINVISWGAYKTGVIAVTYIWYIGDTIIETDTKLNTYYKWSLNGEPGKMDLQNIMTHEFGHWCGLDDLYTDQDYWLTMYGYAAPGETYKRSLGLGDILGLQARYKP